MVPRAAILRRMTAPSPPTNPTGAAGVDHGVSRREATKVWATVAAHSFGGPAGQIAVMHRFLVEERRWISEQRFLHALNYCMLLPGPEAQQLATYIGWLMHGPSGGFIAGGLFILPGIIAIFALSLIYAVFGDIGPVAGLLFGLQAAVVAIVVEAVLRIGKRALKTRTHVAIAAAAFLAIFFGEVPFPWIVLGSGVFGYVMGRWRPTVLATPVETGDSTTASLIGDDSARLSRGASLAAMRAAAVALVAWAIPVVVVMLALGPDAVYSQLAVFFSKSAVVTFGGAYAVLSYVAQAAVSGYGWLQPGEMLTGLGMAETTPGPLIMVVQFVGFMAGYRNPGGLSPLVAATAAAAITTWVTFAPCFFFIFAGAPFIERLRGNHNLSAALSAITAAVVGVILNLAVWFAIHTLFRDVSAQYRGGFRFLTPRLASVDFAALALMVLGLLLIFRFRIGVLRTLAICAGLGLLLALARGGI